MSVLDDMRPHFDAGFEDDTEVSEVGIEVFEDGTEVSEDGYLIYLSSTGLKYLSIVLKFCIKVRSHVI
ncbi:hypothetical protein E4U35_005639 [Claviceps purpurea]|nr:hypothetical protein E4U10_006012 [Claviceps purpurea]KAG6201706.1 hypothetical protein E4U35_005639 [Claviceps purpurea]KAG6277158.1 hypothetical protein E4U47_007433 [Claviceps purpurea]